MTVSAVWMLIRKEFMLEWRQHSALSGVFLYLVATVFVCYLAFEGIISVRSWNALYWVIMLFASVNVSLKSFVQEHEQRHLYYYTMVAPRAAINAKIIYNALLMMFMGLAGFGIFVAFMGNPVASLPLFLVNMLLGMAGFSSVLCMVSAIAARVRNNFTLVAILGFPLILPMLLLLIGVSHRATTGASLWEAAPDFLIMGLLIAVTLLLSNILFPYIWKE